jgi:hypothetical protein
MFFSLLLYSLGLFGVLKQRFRFLRNSVIYHDPKVIEYAVKTAVILHNMILLYDGKDRVDIAEWERVQWEHVDPDIPDALADLAESTIDTTEEV